MKNLWVIGILALLLASAISYAEEAIGPKETLLKFQKCLRLEAYRTAADYLSKDFLNMLKATTKDPSEWLKEEMGGDFHKKFEIVSMEEEDDYAIAKIKMPNENTSGTLYLIKEGTTWKISPVPRERLEDLRIITEEAAKEKAEKAAYEKPGQGKKKKIKQ